MYVADPRITHVPAAREQVVSLLASLNKPHIAVPGKPAQEVQAYVVGAALQPGAFTIFVYLYLTQSQEAVVYVDADRLRVDAQAYAEAESDAAAFCESMGFMLETLNYRQLAPAQQAELHQSLPCFNKNPRAVASVAEAQPARNDTPQARLARLLAAF